MSSGVVKKILTFASGNILLQIIPLALYPVLTRMYSVDAFGILAIFSSLGAISAYFVSLQYTPSIVVCSDKQVRSITQLCLLLSFIVSSLLLSVVVLFTDDFVSYNNIVTESPQIFYLVPLFVLCSSIIEIYAFQKNRVGKYRDIVKVNFLKIILTYAWLFLCVDLFVENLIVGLVVGASVIGGYCIWRLISLNKNWSFSRMRDVAKTYREFPLVRIPHAIFDIVNNHGITFAILYFYGMTQLGLFSLVVKLMKMPINTVSSAISKVIFAEASQHDLSFSLANLKVVHIVVLLMYTLCFVIVFLHGGAIFSFVLGSEWEASGKYAEILSPYFLFYSFSSMLSFVPTAKQKQKAFLYLTIVGNMVQISTIVIGGYYLSFDNMLKYYSACGSIVFLVYIGFCMHLLRPSIKKIRQ